MSDKPEQWETEPYVRPNWVDPKTIPNMNFGKAKLPGCECDFSFTCRVCLQYADDRNKAEEWMS